MPSPFHGIDLASRALRAFQRQLDVTGHNIGNVNTPGYSRQVVDLVQTEGTTFYGLRPFTLGGGVSIDNVNRIRDQFLEVRRTGENSHLGKFSTLTDGLEGVQSLINEPGPNGISDALNAFFNNWSAFASNPGQPGAAQMVQTSASTMTQRIRGTYGDMISAKAQVISGLDSTFQSIDGLTTRIAQLNESIRQKLATGEQPNDLMDMRDAAIQDLSNVIDIKTFRNSDGGISVYMNQFTLVDSGGSHSIPRTYDAATSTVTDGTLTYEVRSGKLNGLFGTLNSITGYMTKLDTLANSLRTSVNALHVTGTNPNNTTGLNFFNDVVPPLPQTGAIDFDLDPAIKADVNNIAPGTSGAAGDGGLALAISRLRDDTTIAGLGGKSPTNFYADIVASIGQDVNFYTQSLETQKAVMEQIDAQRQSISGVSLDDEMADMMKFQRAYQAAAKALTVFDQVTEDLINMLRR